MDLDGFPDGILIAGPDGIVEYANQRLLDLACDSVGTVVGLHIADAIPFDDLCGNTWYDCVRPYDGFELRTSISEQSWFSPHGVEFLITASLQREHPAGKVQRVVVSIRTARIRNKRDRQRSDLVATVAHELRSPLTGIKGFTSTLLSKWDRFSDEQRQFMLETVDADADRLSRLITELLDAARIDAGRLTLRRGPVQVDDVVQRVLTNVSAGSGDPFPITAVGDIDLVWGDEDRLAQVATNLVENALRHGHGLRQVLVLNEAGTDGRPGVSFEFADLGPGIPLEDRQRVFSRFWRYGPGAGSGLGMYIVQGIVGEHGGTVHIGDADGGGAAIRVWLPVNEPDALTD